MYPPEGDDHLGNFIAWDATTGKIKWSLPEPFSVWSGALATAGNVVFYGTLEGYLKAVDAETGKELYKFKTPSGIIGNVNTYEYDGKQYVAVLSGVGGWAGIGMRNCSVLCSLRMKSTGTRSHDTFRIFSSSRTL